MTNRPGFVVDDAGRSWPLELGRLSRGQAAFLGLGAIPLRADEELRTCVQVFGFVCFTTLASDRGKARVVAQVNLHRIHDAAFSALLEHLNTRFSDHRITLAVFNEKLTAWEPEDFPSGVTAANWLLEETQTVLRHGRRMLVRSAPFDEWVRHAPALLALSEIWREKSGRFDEQVEQALQRLQLDGRQVRQRCFYDGSLRISHMGQGFTIPNWSVPVGRPMAESTDPAYGEFVSADYRYALATQIPVSSDLDVLFYPGDHRDPERRQYSRFISPWRLPDGSSFVLGVSVLNASIDLRIRAIRARPPVGNNVVPLARRQREAA